jgi:hypothetical protein
MMFQVRGPAWNLGGLGTPQVFVNPLWYDPTDPSPQLATCESPSYNYDNTIVACMLRAPSTGVFNISIVAANWAYYGLVVKVDGVRLESMYSADGCGSGAPGHRLRGCYHGAKISIPGIGLAGMVGTSYLGQSQSASVPYGLVYDQYNLAPINDTAQVAKLVITEAAIIAELAVYEKLNGNLRFYFQAYREGISVIDGPFNEAKVTFNITSAPIEVKFVDLFGYGGSNPQVGTEASPILAVGTGFTLTTAIQEEHWMWVEVEPPVITGITGSCEQTAQLSVDPVYGINYNTWQDGLIAINCMHASTITISGGGFADGGTLPRFFLNTSEATWNITADPFQYRDQIDILNFITADLGTVPECYTVTRVSNYKVLCEVNMGTVAFQGTHWTVGVDSVVALNTGFGKYSSARYTPLGETFSITFKAPTFTGISGCMHGPWSTHPAASVTAVGCTGLTNVTFHGTGFYPTTAQANMVNFEEVGVSANQEPLPTMECIASTATTLTCRLDVPFGTHPDEIFNVNMTIIGLSVDTTFRFTKLLPQARDLAFGRAYAASAVASADGSPLLFSIGGEHAEGWVYDTVVAYTVNASRVESGMYNSSDALWVQKASLAEPRSCAVAVGVPENQTIYSADNRYIYLFGGTNDGSAGSCYEGRVSDRRIYMYDVENDAAGWTRLTDMPTTRDRRPANTFNYGLYFNDGMAGQYFDVDVHYDVEIAGMDIYVHNASGIQTWSIYFKAGSYKGSEHSPNDWTLLTEYTFTPGVTGKMRYPGLFPTLNLRASAYGGVYSFYIYSTLEIGVFTNNEYDADIAPGGYYFTMKSGLGTEERRPFGATSPHTSPEFGGSLVFSPPASRCFALSRVFETFNVTDYNDTNKSVAWWLPGPEPPYPDNYQQVRYIMPVAVESYITDFELTIQAHATRPINITRDFEIRLTDPNNRTFIPTFETHIDAVWPVTDAGGYGSWVRFKAGVTDPLMSIYSFPGSAEEMANSTYDNPRLYGSSQWMLDILATNPSNMSLAGEWLLEFRDLSPNDDARLNVTAAEIRVCWQQPAELGQAASAVGSKVYLTGGVSFGQLAYVPTPMTESSIAVNTTSYIPLYADAFSEIMSLKLGISLIGEAKTAFTNMHLIMGQPFVGGGLRGQWLADGSTLDASDYDLHGAMGPGFNKSFFAQDPDATSPKYPVFWAYDGLLLIPYFGRPAEETRSAWVRINREQIGYVWYVKPTSAVTIISWGNAVQQRDDFTQLVIIDGKLRWEEVMSAIPTLGTCQIEGGGGLMDGSWHHVAGTRDSSGMVRLYIDGVEVAASTCDVFPTDLDDYRVGQTMKNRVASDTYRGMLFDVRQYSTVLTEAEIKTLYNGGWGGQVVTIMTKTHAMRQSQPLTFQQFGTPDSPYTNITTATETNYPDPNIVFATEGNLSAVTSASGGRWYLVVEVDCGIPENDPRDEYCHGVDYATWGITVRGLIGLPNRGTLEFDTITAQFTDRTILSMQLARYGHASVAVGTSVYVIGGSQSKPVTFTQPLDSIECMDTSHGYLAWRLLPNKMSQGRWAPAAAAVGKVIYVTGGWGSSGEPLTSVEMFNTTDLTWTLLTNKAINVPRYYGIFGLIHDRLYFGGGLVPHYAAELQNVYYSNKYNLYPLSYTTSDKLDFIDVQPPTASWSRMPGFEVVGADCYSQDFTSFEDVGSFYFGILSSESDCAVACEAVPDCAAYEYHTANYTCYGREEIGHRCSSKPAQDRISAYRADVTEEKVLQTTLIVQFDTAVTGVKTISFDVEVNQVDLWYVVLTGLTLNIQVAQQQKIRVFWKSGTHVGFETDAAAWTEITTTNGITIYPSSPGKYRLDQIFSQTMWYGTNALKVTSEYTGSLGYADQPVAGMRTVSNPAVVGEVANEDYYLKVKAGTLQSDTYGANLGTGVLNVGLSYQTEWNGKTTRSHCFTPYPHQGWNAGRKGLPWNTQGFKIFTRLWTNDATVRQGIIHKSALAANIMAEGGFAVSLVSSYISVYTVVGWQQVGPQIQSETWYNVQFEYDPEGKIDSRLWRIVINDQVYAGAWSYIPNPRETVQHNLWLGCEGKHDQAPWLGEFYWTTIDCHGPSYDLLSLTPNTTLDGVQSEDDNHISLRFDREVALNGGKFYLQLSVVGGLHDKEVFKTVTLNGTTPWPTKLSTVNSRTTVSSYLDGNFSLDTRYQVSTDVGMIHNVFDAGVWEGLPYAAPEEGVWWFKVSGEYMRKVCDGKPCAVCDACIHTGTSQGGDQEYLCYIPTQAGMIEVPRINVDTVPTHDCP